MESTPPPVDAEAPVSPEAEDGELRLGSSARGTAANGVILALTRAARSFLLYDPSNEAIRHFLAALRSTVEGYLAEFGELPLEVRPFELVVEGEVVYLDRDRERSLAFRLYRDGVRRITLQAGLTWHEILKLMEVLSIRYTGVRQAEDDMVVLLWKAGFENIQLEAVEGFVPEEEVGDATAYSPAGGTAGRHVEIPADFDLPLPPLSQFGPLQYRAITPAELEQVQADDATQMLPDLCVRLSEELINIATDPTEPMDFPEIVPQLREIRDFLLAEGLLNGVLAMVRLLASARLTRPADLHERDVLLASFGDQRAMGRLLRSMGRDATGVPPEMIELLDRIPGNHLEMAINALGTEKGEAARRVARSLVERYVPTQGDWILAQLPAMEGSIALEVLRAFAAANPARAMDAVQIAAARPEMELQLEALHILERLPATTASGKLLVTMLSLPSEEVRIRSLELIGKQGAKPAFAALVERVKRDAALRLSHREGEAAGEALARIEPGRAFELFRDWLKPKGIFGAVLPGQAMLQWVAVSGLVWIPSEEAETLIKNASERAGSELAQHCTRCMVKRRRMARGAL